MLSSAARKCTDYLLLHNKISRERTAVYVYGFELLFSTASCVICILLLGFFFDYFALSVTFLAYFVPIRIMAGGYHAKSYERCFFLTNAIAVFCAAGAKYLQQWNGPYLYGALGLALAASAWVIWKNAPIIPAKYRQKTDKYERNRRYAHRVLVLELAALSVMVLFENSCMACTAVLTSCAVAVMMILAKKEGN